MSQFQSLGTKATRRGIKKCKKCGFYNGTKSIACKNKGCDMVFKDSSEKRKILSDAVQLITGNLRKLYSVRVRDQGPDYRGFVQLPLSTGITVDARSQFSDIALCFVDNCPRLFQDSTLQCHESLWDTTNSCPHINASAKCRFVATPLSLKLHIILKLKSTKEIKEKLWVMANERNIPLVQRVSKHVMAVRCQVTPKHPLGYLHFIFNTGRHKEEPGFYFCDCSDFVHNPKCIHFYSCICALASDAKYASEFSYLINLEFEEFSKHLCTPNQTEIERKIQVSIPSKEKTCKLSMIESTKTNAKRKNKLRNNTKHSIMRKIWPKVYPIQINIVNNSNTKEGNQQEINPIWTYDNWLSYVVESMNKLIIFENAGLLNSLVFDIPLDFYKALRKRISKEYLKTVRESLDYEIIHIMNIRHVKEIFANTKTKLRVSKRFILTQDSTYVEIDETRESEENLMPHFIYFLNVGQLTVDDSDNTNNSFVIEWMLNSGHNSIGQLKLQYKYGRKCL